MSLPSIKNHKEDVPIVSLFNKTQSQSNIELYQSKSKNEIDNSNSNDNNSNDSSNILISSHGDVNKEKVLCSNSEKLHSNTLNPSPISTTTPSTSTMSEKNMPKWLLDMKKNLLTSQALHSNTTENIKNLKNESNILTTNINVSKKNTAIYIKQNDKLKRKKDRKKIIKNITMYPTLYSNKDLIGYRK